MQLTYFLPLFFAPTILAGRGCNQFSVFYQGSKSTPSPPPTQTKLTQTPFLATADSVFYQNRDAYVKWAFEPQNGGTTCGGWCDEPYVKDDLYKEMICWASRMKKTHSGYPAGIGGVDPFGRLKGCDNDCVMNHGQTCHMTVRFALFS